MTFLIIFYLLSTSASADDIWQLRSGVIPVQGASVSSGSNYSSAINGLSAHMNGEELREGLESGYGRLLFPLAGNLVRSGYTAEAELFWLHSDDAPANRGELLAALSWFGRYQLYSLMTDRAETPPDMEGRLHEDHCAAVCSAGWMTVRSDGLFHPEELVQKGDLILLSRYFPRFSGLPFLPLSELDRPPSEGE